MATKQSKRLGWRRLKMHRKIFFLACINLKKQLEFIKKEITPINKSSENFCYNDA